MKKIIVVGICLLLIGGLIMPAHAHNFTIYLDSDSGDGANASFYLEGELVGKADKNGKVILNVDDLEPGKMYNVTVKKEGYIDMTIEVYKAARDNGIRCAYSGYRCNYSNDRCSYNDSYYSCSYCHEPTLTPEPTITPPPEPTIAPTAPPLPEGYKSQEQRIKELEKEVAEHEGKITFLSGKVAWLENKVNGILNWVRSKFGDLI